MPQMMPLNWLLLMVFFIMIFFMYNNFNYFNFLYKTSNKIIKNVSITLHWKW